MAEELGRAASSSSVVPYLPRLPLLPSKTRTLKKQGENKENVDGGLDASEILASSSAPGTRGQSRKRMSEEPVCDASGPWPCPGSMGRAVHAVESLLTSSVFSAPGSQIVTQMSDDRCIWVVEKGARRTKSECHHYCPHPNWTLVTEAVV